MPNYQNGKIYKLVNTEGTLTYIGSTCQSLAQRKAKHHSDFKCWKLGKRHYVSSYKIFEDDEEGCQIVLLEAVVCNNRNELEKRERYYIESNECVNKYRPTRTMKEWVDENKEKLKSYNQNYFQNNKNAIYEKRNTNECKEYMSNYLALYYHTNKEEILKQHREYRQQNKDKILALNNRKVVCECGKTTSHGNSFAHKKTKRHQNYVKSIKVEQDELDKLEEEFNRI
jgi:hypothetical protein